MPYTKSLNKLACTNSNVVTNWILKLTAITDVFLFSNLDLAEVYKIVEHDQSKIECKLLKSELQLAYFVLKCIAIAINQW